MARDTLPRIRRAALDLFGSRWFDTVSVAEICRRASVSNGVFYRYYRSKAELFSSLLDEFLERFEADLRTVSGQVSMFREGQYRHPEYEQRLRRVYIETLERVYQREVTEVEYLYLLSGLRFLATRSLYDRVNWDLETLADVLMRGVFPGAAEPVRLEALPPPPEFLPESSLERLTEAGIRLFGTQGFHPVQVADIVREAGLSVGTFYNCFESKEAFLAHMVDSIGRRTRRYLSEHLPRDVSRWQLEVRGMWTFLAYFGRHPEYYEIVREAEFVRPVAVRDYYRAFEEGYCENLQEIPEEHRSAIANVLMGISHYLGIEVLFSKGVADARKTVHKLGALLASGVPE